MGKPIRFGSSSGFGGALRFGTSHGPTGYAMTTTLSDGYATLEQADDIIGEVNPWFSATDAAKMNALRMGRLYIDSNYSCGIDETDPDDEVILANTQLAQISLSTSLFPVATNTSVKKKSVKAGPVSTSTEYDSYASKRPDPYPQITAMLKIIGCQYTGRSTTKFFSRA